MNKYILKHIYAGTQRIASKLGDIDAFGADPRRVATAGHDVDGAEPIDFGTKYKNQNSSLSSRYDSLKVKTKPKENNDYVNGKSFCCSGNSLDEIEKNNTQTAENAKLEDNLYFYHPDHLGSTSMVTNYDGEVTQNVAYIPYGEVFVEERNGSWATPFLFNAKELDEETGLYYYGARYLDPTDCRWLSTDPMFEKYVGMSPYNYCAGNPVKMVDPDGEEIGISVDGETFTYNPYIEKNVYKGENTIIAGFVSTLNKINSTKIGNKLLTSLHKSDRKYLITNETSQKGTRATVSTKDGAKNEMGNSASLVEMSHELFHSYQYEMGQGGASIWNEVEAYAYSNRLVDEYIKNLPDDVLDFEQFDGFDMAREGRDPYLSYLYENGSRQLIDERNAFQSGSFNTCVSIFKEVSQKNLSGIYNAPYYKKKLPTNKNYLLKNFFQMDNTKLLPITK